MKTLRLVGTQAARVMGVRAGRPLLVMLLLLMVTIPLPSGRQARAEDGPLLPPPTALVAAHYDIQGNGPISFAYKSPEGRRNLEACDVDLLQSWNLSFDGTVDTFAQSLKGTIARQGGLEPDRSKWHGTQMQCGPGQHTWIDYRYDYFIRDGSFSGTYDSNGNLHMLGHFTLVAGLAFSQCITPNGIVSCDTVYPSANPTGPALALGTEPGLVAAVFDNRALEVTGKITFYPNGNIGISGAMSLPESHYDACCLVHDDFSGSVDIAGTPVPPGQ